MKILLSIKPQFAEKIFNGTKKFEYRKSIFKNKEINKVVVYASAPIQRVIGEFVIDEILEDNIKSLWNQTKEFSGINEEFYFKYFKSKEKGFAIKIKEVNKYEIPLSIQNDFNIIYPPQSFMYLE